MSEAAAAWYVYGVVSASTQPEGTGIGSRPVEAVSEGGVAALVSAVDPDAKDNPLFLCPARVPFQHPALDRDRARDRLDDTWKLDQ